MNFSPFHYRGPRFGRLWNGDDEKLERKMRLRATSCSGTPLTASFLTHSATAPDWERQTRQIQVGCRQALWIYSLSRFMFEKWVANLGECYLFTFHDFLQQEGGAKRLRPFRLRLKHERRTLLITLTLTLTLTLLISGSNGQCVD